jgi:EAL domain-containing protein (putative c-di-GMP-specific phosphodiesterase class I)
LRSSGLIVPIGEWVMREVCHQIRAWQIDGLPPMRIAVNVSATQFQQRDLGDIVRRALDAAHIHASHLEIELTRARKPRRSCRESSAWRTACG